MKKSIVKTFFADGMRKFIKIAALILLMINGISALAGGGMFLIAWIVAQVYFLQSFDMLHVIFGTVGILMLLCGLLLAKKLK